MLLAIHQLSAIPPGLQARDPAASAILTGKIRDPLQHRCRPLWYLVILLVLLAASDACYCIWVQLGKPDLQYHSRFLAILLCLQSETCVCWTCDRGGRQEGWIFVSVLNLILGGLLEMREACTWRVLQTPREIELA